MLGAMPGKYSKSFSPPFKTVEFDIMYGEGFSKAGELIDLGVKAGIVEKSGSWFSYDSQRIGQGRENVRQFLKDNPDIADAIERQVRQSAGLLSSEMMTAPENSEGNGDGEDGESESAEADGDGLAGTGG